ncbi:MAG: hypothetical protein IJ272_01430 [Clostridia bacterium]|nr:hypothetical protein [Clostridia bacterium]
MKKFLDFVYGLDKFAIMLGSVFAILAILLLVWANHQPLDTAELTTYNANLELLKQDFDNIYLMEDVFVEVGENEVVVRFEGDEVGLNAVFDKQKEYVCSEIIDCRAQKDPVFCLLLLVFAFSFGPAIIFCIQLALLIPVFLVWLIKSFIKLILYIPIGINELISKFKKNFEHGDDKT